MQIVQGHNAFAALRVREFERETQDSQGERRSGVILDPEAILSKKEVTSLSQREGRIGVWLGGFLGVHLADQRKYGTLASILPGSLNAASQGLVNGLSRDCHLFV